MTTPERLRRRQRIEGGVLILVGIAMILQTAWFERRDREQRDCLADQFTELTVALNARADLAQRESTANRRVNLAEYEVTSDREFVERLQEYANEIRTIRRLREETPVPDYPSGSCDGGQESGGGSW